jgi:hypothetical protein
MMFTFAGTIAFTEDWELVERVINFHPIVDKEHEGEFAAKAMAKALSDMGVLEKIRITFLLYLLIFLFHTLSDLSYLLFNLPHSNHR